jgi:hypothetical protein
LQDFVFFIRGGLKGFVGCYMLGMLESGACITGGGAPVEKGSEGSGVMMNYD